jgi:hypothetical protein
MKKLIISITLLLGLASLSGVASTPPDCPVCPWVR